MSDHHDNVPEVPEQQRKAMASEEPIANPGLPAHLPRPTDVDDKAARRAERQVASFFVLSMVCTVLFVVAYFALDIKDGDQETIGGLGASNVALGVSLGLALLFIGIGIIQWARKLMADVEIIEYRHPAVSSPADREETLAALSMGLDDHDPWAKNALAVYARAARATPALCEPLAAFKIPDTGCRR